MAKKAKPNTALVALLLIASFAGIYLIVNAPFPGIMKFFAGVILLLASGMALKRLANLEGEWGMLLVRDSRGLGAIDRIAKWNPHLWQTFADFGLVMGFGIFGFFLMGREGRNLKRDIALFVASMIVLAFTTLFIVPHIYPVASSIITSVDLNAASSQIKQSMNGNTSILGWVSLIALAVGGLCMTSALSVIGYGLVVAGAVVSALMGSGSALASTAPGATLVLPGINLPLIEGILALAVILVVHEAAHGILARVANVKLRSAGIALIGVLPAGAFIDPDEKALAKKEDIAQHRVLVAGSTANIVACIVFFVLLGSFVFVSAPGRVSGIRIEQSATLENGSVVLNERPVPAGTVITQINGEGIESYLARLANSTNSGNSSAKPNETIVLTSIEGREYALKANGNGSIASQVVPYTIILKSGDALLVKTAGKDAEMVIEESRYLYARDFGWLGFIYNVLGLAFCLNFLVGAVNLLPLPVFDGHRIISLGLKNEKLMNLITAAVLLGFILNFLPWIFR